MASSERDEQRRSAFGAYVEGIVSERFVFVDECSTNISLSPIYARAPRGERAPGKAPRNWGKNVSLVCAIDSEGVKPSMSVEGAVDGKAFESYIEHSLAPELKALVEATGHALDAITPEDIRGFYSDCGYRLPLQSL